MTSCLPPAPFLRQISARWQVFGSREFRPGHELGVEERATIQPDWIQKRLDPPESRGHGGVRQALQDRSQREVEPNCCVLRKNPRGSERCGSAVSDCLEYTCEVEARKGASGDCHGPRGYGRRSTTAILRCSCRLRKLPLIWKVTCSKRLLAQQ